MVGLILKIFVALSIVGGMSFLLVWLLGNRSLIVARDGSGHYETLSQALENVKPGGRIEIRKGLYTEDRLIIDKPVTIVGADQDKVTINVKSVIIIRHSGVTLRDVTVHGLRSTSRPATKTAQATPRRRAFPVVPAAMLFQSPLNKGGGSESGAPSFPR